MDARVSNGRLVFANDIPKVDGLQLFLNDAFDRHGMTNYFLFNTLVSDAVFKELLSLTYKVCSCKQRISGREIRNSVLSAVKLNYVSYHP